MDTSRFAGTCYRAANWRMAGVATGCTRQNKTQTPQAASKAVRLYPLRQDLPGGAVLELIRRRQEELARSRPDEAVERIPALEDDVFEVAHARINALFERDAADIPGGSPARAAPNKARRPTSLTASRIMTTAFLPACLLDPNVPFPNNQGGQDMIKAKQKTSGCFRTLEDAKCFVCIRAIPSSAASRVSTFGMPAFKPSAICQLFQNQVKRPEWLP